MASGAHRERAIDPAPHASSTRSNAEYAVHATRYGKSVRVDVAARRVSRAERSAFDEPDRWQIEVVASGWPAPALKRLVNGSTRVEREPSGSATWDVNVEFSIAFELPHAVDEVRVTLRPPGRPRAVITVPVAEVVAMLDLDRR